MRRMAGLTAVGLAALAVSLEGQAPAPPSSSSNATAANTAPLGSGSSEATTWVAEPRGKTYFRNAKSCAPAGKLRLRVYFRTEAEAQTKGYRRSTAKGC